MSDSGRVRGGGVGYRLAGSAALDYILCAPPRQTLIQDILAQFLILVGIWYIWWERRQPRGGSAGPGPNGVVDCSTGSKLFQGDEEECD